MATYRVCCIYDDEMAEVSEFDAEDDKEALALLAIRGEKTDCELWQGGRLVATVKRGANPLWFRPNAV